MFITSCDPPVSAMAPGLIFTLVFKKNFYSEIFFIEQEMFSVFKVVI